MFREKSQGKLSSCDRANIRPRFDDPAALTSSLRWSVWRFHPPGLHLSECYAGTKLAGPFDFRIRQCKAAVCDVGGPFEKAQRPHRARKRPADAAAVEPPRSVMPLDTNADSDGTRSFPTSNPDMQ